MGAADSKPLTPHPSPNILPRALPSCPGEKANQKTRLLSLRFMNRARRYKSTGNFGQFNTMLWPE
jgi:hypothetical protein